MSVGGAGEGVGPPPDRFFSVHRAFVAPRQLPGPGSWVPNE